MRCGQSQANDLSADRRWVPFRVEWCATRAGTHLRPELKTWAIAVFLEVLRSPPRKNLKEPAMTHLRRPRLTEEMLLDPDLLPGGGRFTLFATPATNLALP